MEPRRIVIEYEETVTEVYIKTYGIRSHLLCLVYEVLRKLKVLK